MEQSHLSFAALIGSRICHDLISPIGAINNGLELLGMSANQNSPEMALISESVENAAARIRFFRVAYGSAGLQMMGPPEVSSILSDLSQGGRLQINWLTQDPQPRALVRMAFLALQCLETAMPFGGNVDVKVENESWNLTGTARKVTIDPDLWGALNTKGNCVDISPAHVQFMLLPAVALEMQRTLVSELGETTVRLQF